MLPFSEREKKNAWKKEIIIIWDKVLFILTSELFYRLHSFKFPSKLFQQLSKNITYYNAYSQVNCKWTLFHPGVGKPVIFNYLWNGQLLKYVICSHKTWRIVFDSVYFVPFYEWTSLLCQPLIMHNYAHLVSKPAKFTTLLWLKNNI